jgi:CheY-like chemotaxis protein
MSKQGPIIIIEDDREEQDILKEVFAGIQVKNQLVFFDGSEEAYTYLEKTFEKPFLIVTDINLPGMTGIELRAKINANEFLRKKSIPFIFLTTAVQRQAVELAYDMMVQGFFQKPNTIDEIRTLMRMIIDYWSICKHPNNTP